MIQVQMRKMWLFFAAWGLIWAADLRPSWADEPAPATSAAAPGTAAPTDTAATPKDAATKPDATKPAAKADAPKGRNPRVFFIVKKGSKQCEEILTKLRAPGGDFENMRAGGWLIGDGPDNHVQIVDCDAVPDLVKKLKVSEFPAVACVDKGELVRYFKSGCTTPLDCWTLGFLATGTDLRPKGSPVDPATVETTGHYPLRGNHWSVDGNFNPTKVEVIEHLHGPNHVEHLQPEWKLDTWALEELKSLHDDLHEKFGPPSADEPSGSASDNFQHLKGRGGASGF